jgi:hypothetical protein
VRVLPRGDVVRRAGPGPNTHRPSGATGEPTLRAGREPTRA